MKLSKWQITTIVETGVIICLIVFVLLPKSPIIVVQTEYETRIEPPLIKIAPSYREPSFVYVIYNDTFLMGGMWAVSNGTRSIDIRDFNPNAPIHSEIYCHMDNLTFRTPRLDYVTVVTVWGFGNRTAVWHPDHESNTFEVEVTWEFKGEVFLESLIDPYWEYAGSWWYDPSQVIHFWNATNSYSMSYATVPQEQYIKELQGVRLNYVPPDLTKNYTLFVYYNDNSTATFAIDDAHGTDFYRVFYNQTWSEQVQFSYSIQIKTNEG